MNELYLLHSCFQDIAKNGTGGVLDVNSVKLFVGCCTFHNITSTLYGGCFYAKNSHLFLKNSFFETCFVAVPEDEYLGNIFYVDNKESSDGTIISTIDQISYTKCGETNSSGDSSICMNCIHYHVANINSSFNGGTSGSSLFSGYNSLEDSYVKYSQDFNSTSFISVVSTEKVYECIYCNFIITKNLQFSILFTLVNNTLTVRTR